MRVAVAAELAPAKTFLPIIKRLNHDFHCLCHGEGVEKVLGGYCSHYYRIGTSRSRSGRKMEIAYLVMRDIATTWRALGVSKPELVLTCGNAGDVRKAISAALIRKKPVIHVEQDIYNPIEMIAFADLVTAPSESYRDYLEDEYLLQNVEVIGGYPHALYVNELTLRDPGRHGVFLAVLGGDLKKEDLPGLLNELGKLEKKVLVVPFRFRPDYVRSLVSSKNVEILEGFVDLPSLMRASDALIYGAGMGITIEAAVLGVPAIKLCGFHRNHASVDLARSVGIQIAEIDQINDIILDIKPPKGKKLVENAISAVEKLTKIIEDYSEFLGHRGGFKSMKRIWKARKSLR